MTVLNERDKEIIRAFLMERRNKLIAKMTEMQASLQEIETLLLGVVEKSLSNSHVSVEAPTNKKKAMLEALIAAGSDGLTAMEASRITGLVAGTSSSILAKMKQSGLANHIQPRYFYIQKSSKKPSTASKPAVPYISIIFEEIQQAGETGLTASAIAARLKNRGIEKNTSQVRSLVSHALINGKIQKIDGGDAPVFVAVNQQPVALETASVT